MKRKTNINRLAVKNPTNIGCQNRADLYTMRVAYGLNELRRIITENMAYVPLKERFA